MRPNQDIPNYPVPDIVEVNERREGNSPVVCSTTEFIVGGRRFAAGTYKIVRVGITPTDDNQF